MDLDARTAIATEDIPGPSADAIVVELNP